MSNENSKNFDSTSLFRFAEHIEPTALAANDRLDTLVIAVGAFSDTGHTDALFTKHLLNSTENFLVGEFDIDQLHDYTGRRPPITFEYDRFGDYQRPRLEIHHLTDSNGRPFLLLSGCEPSMKWERVASSIIGICELLGIKHTYVVNSAPAPTPHTRPVWVTAYASSSDLVRGKDKMPAVIQMQASFPAMLTIRLSQANLPVVGFCANVPHYLADIEYPDAVIALINELDKSTDIQIGLGELPKMANTTRSLIDPQVQGSAQLQQSITELEKRYDQFVAQASLPGAQQDIPTADEIGAEVEDFLRQIDESKTDDQTGAAGDQPNNGQPEQPNIGQPDLSNNDTGNNTGNDIGHPDGSDFPSKGPDFPSDGFPSGGSDFPSQQG